ncbi:hypothetical protein HD806DRAFT_302640 [Xylariaceae sp. AK1471]|nr:hypothetical protein HD806DRAFT_302640 [Xylariaceae sp. AK1471]
MDCLERLKRRTRESRPRTATVRTLRDSAECPQSTAKTRRIHCSARNNKKEKKKKERRKSGVIVCPTQEAYTCQSTLLILLHTRFRNTLHPIHQEDSQRTIEYDRAALSRSSRGLVSFDTLLQYLCWENTISIQLPYLNALEESLIDALRLLHSRNISFPVSVEDIEFSRHWQSDRGDIKTFKLFLPYNKKASWASDNLPPTWKADQLESARSIFFIPKSKLVVTRSTRCLVKAHYT